MPDQNHVHDKIGLRNGPAPEILGAGGGLECRSCGCRHFLVVYTRPTDRSITRVRACRHCGRRIITRETLVGDPIRGSYGS